MYYLFLFILFSFFSYISLTDIDDRQKKIFYFISFFLFVFTAGLRYETGTDYFSYKEIYEQTNSILSVYNGAEISSIPAEPLYLLYNSIFKTLGFNLNIMFLSIAFINGILLFDSLKKYIDNYRFISLLIYFSFVYFTLDMSGVRQAIAINIFFFSFRFIQERSLIKYMILIFIASLFHVSALFCLFFYFLLNKEYSSKFLLLFIGFSLFIILLRIPIILIMVESILEKLVPATAFFKLIIYSTSNKPWVFNFKIIVFLLIFLLVLFYRNVLIQRFKYFNIILNSLFFYLVFRMLFWESIEISSRMMFYFIFGLILAVPMVIELITKNSDKLIILTLFIFFNFYHSFEFYFKTNMHNPYQNYLIYKFYDLRSTGQERMNSLINNERNN